MTAPHTVEFSAATPDDETRLGGKCASLVRMVRSGAPVPPGFAVTTAAWNAMLGQGGLARRIAAAVEGLQPGDVAGQQAAAECIAKLFAGEPLPAEVAAAVTCAYETLCRMEGADGDLPVAVRSSATAEDLPDASFAGQQDTYLWVVGVDDVLRRVRDCWASLYTARAIGYRADRGIAHAGVQMAVGVQKMVDARVAGVAMTLDPLNGDRTRIAIDASWGLGETVVSGDVTPDHFVVDKVLRQVVSRTISSKAVEVVADRASRCTVHRDVPADRREAPCLDDQQIQAVASMARQLEKQFGGPQDIEWAFEDTPGQPCGRLMLLQCRPETVWSQRKPGVAHASAGLSGLVANLLTPVRIQA
ncbi:phosphoenolpyruvate synthase [Caenimonas sedimenti]|uniref:Phosphoenolpyruvate synthase n=1 Tax=Caenimonas sedimenti TaxID=2596921 RepID=A0A562ZW82_9BURK|nr:PEP/pyruvate-binding domain-containing protein [Caenimonas sedimenti]TWO72850.1 phosphoenolpyruvate synthase [Caenimonas sedimenti]